MMSKAQLLLIVGGVILVVVLYRLPRVVVENETDAEIESHDFSITPEDEEVIARLRQRITDSDSENYVNFADSLARYYLRYGLIDSAASVSRRTLMRDSSLYNLRKVAYIIYSVFERTTSPEKAGVIASEARLYLQKILDQEPEDLSTMTKLGMTMVVTETPMAGIALLRGVVDKDPNFREAIINLGLLAIRSGQYDRGAERFRSVLEVDSADYEAMLYLGICYLETGQEELASVELKKIVDAENADPALRATAQEYLE